jgi:hypothetical protein
MTDKSAAVLPLLLAFGLLGAGSGTPWDKDSAQWTDRDAQLVLATSPWAQSVSAVMADPRDEMENYSAPLPGPERAGLAGQTNPTANGGRWDGAVGRNRMGSLPSLPVVVRWDSALPVREALRRSAGAPDSDVSPADYVLTVTGLIPGGRYRSAGHTAASSNSDSSADARNPEQILEAFMSFSRLLPRGGAPIAPGNVKLDSASGAIHIFFPRTQPIEAAGTKEVVFLTRFGGFTVRAKFHVKDMRYHGKLTL